MNLIYFFTENFNYSIRYLNFFNSMFCSKLLKNIQIITENILTSISNLEINENGNSTIVQ